MAGRVTTDPEIMGGAPCISGTRIPVSVVVGLFAQGKSESEILSEYPQLKVEDVRAALEFAATVVDDRSYPLRPSA